MADKMPKKYKQVIEAELVARHCTYKEVSEWETKRRTDWKDILCTKRPDLTRQISNDVTFYDVLTSCNVFNKRTIESFKQQRGRCAQISAVLDALTRRPFDDFLRFCESLIESDQKHILTNYFIPEIPAHLLAHTTETDAVLASTTPLTPLPQYDWRRLLRDNLVPLTLDIDPDNGLIRELHSRGVINDWTVDTFQDSMGKSHRVSRILDHILLKRPDEDFQKFCDALRNTKQGHVVDKYLTPGGRDRTDASDPRMVLQLPVDEAELRGCIVPQWKDLLVLHRNEIVEELNASDDLLTELLKHGVMNIAVYEVLREETGQYARAERLLDHLRRRSDNDFARFRLALKKVDQDHVLKAVLDRSSSVNTTAFSNQFEQTRDGATAFHSDEACVKHSWYETVEGMMIAQPAEQEDANAALLVSSMQCRQPVVTQVHVQQGADNSGRTGHAVAVAETGDNQIADTVGPVLPAPAPQDLVEIMDSEQQPDTEEYKGPTMIENVHVRNSTAEFYQDHRNLGYLMSKRPRGRCYIFNMIHVRGMPTRNGTDVDARNIEKLFAALYFQVKVYEDLTAEQMRTAINAISQKRELANDQCFVMFILTHGTTKTVGGKKKDCIFGSDGTFLTPEEILNPLTDVHCPYLKDKPRLFFFQACRGEHYDSTDSDVEHVPGDIARTETDFTPEEPTSYADFLIGYPTQSLFRSFRNTEYGSWYINAFVKVFMKHAHNMGLCSMLNILNGDVSRWMSNTGQRESHNKTQIANYVSNLRQADLYFFPGVSQ